MTENPRPKTRMLSICPSAGQRFSKSYHFSMYHAIAVEICLSDHLSVKCVQQSQTSYRVVMLRFGFIDFDRFRFDFLMNNSISIRFGFHFFTICTPLSTQLDSCVAAWEWQCCGAGHPRSYPPPRPSSAA